MALKPSKEKLSPLDRIRELLIKPILQNKPANMDETDYLNFILHVYSRPISWYWVRCNGWIGGNKMEGGHMASDQISGRKMKRFDSLCVRLDETTHRVDVEANGFVFQMGRTEWEKLRDRFLQSRKDQEDISFT